MSVSASSLLAIIIFIVITWLHVFLCFYYSFRQYQDYPQGAYSPASNQYHYQSSGHQVSHSEATCCYLSLSTGFTCSSSSAQIQGFQGQMVQQMGGHTYVIHGTMDGEGYPLAQTTRAAPATVSYDNRTVILYIINLTL